MHLWLIPMIYVAASVVCGLGLPRIEQLYLSSYTFDLSVSSAQACLSAAASGMMALSGIVFAMAFVMVQFSAIAYSPRLVLWFARDRTLFHSLGVFAATFIFCLFALAWIDRGGSGTVPLFSTLLVAIMLILSMLLFSRLVQRITDLQITNVLHFIGDKGREVIRETFQRLVAHSVQGEESETTHIEGAQLGRPTQMLRSSGYPRIIARLDIDALARQAQLANGIIVMTCAVGDTLVEDTLVLQIHRAERQLPEEALMRAIHLEKGRTFEQDPKYAIRLLVDVAIRALSPAINDPTTAVQTIDQIEDLLLRLGKRRLNVGYAKDETGVLRLIVPMPTWEDFLTLAFDEIRQYGATSVQVMRRLRSALIGLQDSLPGADRAEAVRRYLQHLDMGIERSPLDPEDRVMARQGDRQGLGLPQRQAELKELSL